MNKKKKLKRAVFREVVFIRDNFRCVICGKEDAILKQDPVSHSFISPVLDSHHITPREDMPGGGYVKENGISLCKDDCHLKAEEYLQGVSSDENFSPKALYKRINSSKEKAICASKRLESSS